METGDKVLLVLLAKVACCFGLVLAATGALGGLGVWLLDGAGRWLMGGALIALIAWLVLMREGRAAAKPEPAGQPGDRRSRPKDSPGNIHRNLCGS